MITLNLLRRHKPQAGTGRQESHWGELAQGPIRRGESFHTAVITLPRSDRHSEASFELGVEGPVEVFPAQKLKAKLAAERILELAGLQGRGGKLCLQNNILPNGGGGSSTADVLAAARAAADAIGFELPGTALQRLAFDVERASDPLALMGRGPVIYGSRCGEIFEQITGQLPATVCLGFVSDPDATVLTESLVGCERYTEAEAAEFAGVLEQIKVGIANSCVERIARAATKSARMNQRRLITRSFEVLVDLVLANGAAGMSISHSGVVAAALFDPETPMLPQKMTDLRRALENQGCTEIETFLVKG